jgi:LysR family transcriptional regulator, glycine cleavage system transcriptional activator
MSFWGARRVLVIGPTGWNVQVYRTDPNKRRRVFDHFFVTLQAVVDGLGIGIGPLAVLRTDVTAGRLLTPFSTIQVPRTGYVALVPFDASKTSVLTSFIDWLVAEGSG